MEIKLDYGKSGLKLELENAAVFYPEKQAAVADAAAEIIRKLLSPDAGEGLNRLISAGMKVAIAHTDITRATPNHIIIPAITETLLSLGVREDDITLVNMTGSHRPQTKDELEKMLGKEVASRFKCVQHNSFDKSGMRLLGNLDGHPFYVNREYVDADFKIATGFIEPHFFAGFSGGPKAVLPGLADVDSIMRNHGAERIKCPFATWGRTEGNPVWENIREGCRLAGMNFLVNVAMNAEGKISAVFSGEWEAAHRKGTDFVKRHAMKKADKLYDIVIASNSGYPLDINLYQCVKAMSCAAEIVKEGGTIIIAGECLDGIPSGSHYQKVLASASSPAELFELISSGKLHAPEQWQAQIQARVQKRAKVYVYSDGLSDDEIRSAMLTPCRDIAALVKKLGGSVAVLPKGPQTIAYFEKEN